MKASHFTTPRSLADCTFTTGYAAMESKSYRVLGICVVLSAMLVAGCAAVALTLAGAFGG